MAAATSKAMPHWVKALRTAPVSLPVVRCQKRLRTDNGQLRTQEQRPDGKRWPPESRRAAQTQTGPEQQEQRTAPGLPAGQLLPTRQQDQHHSQNARPNRQTADLDPVAALGTIGTAVTAHHDFPRDDLLREHGP